MCCALLPVAFYLILLIMLARIQLKMISHMMVLEMTRAAIEMCIMIIKTACPVMISGIQWWAM